MKKILFIIVIVILYVFVYWQNVDVKLFSKEEPVKLELSLDDQMAGDYRKWDDFWRILSQIDGELSDDKIEGVNVILEPVFEGETYYQVNPLSCFFTSYYERASDMDLDDFLRYFPYGVVKDELPEFNALREDVNWPFGQAESLKDLPVPIHKYNADVVKTIITYYTGIEDLGQFQMDEAIYLESQNAYYNYTSDFGPGTFICKSGFVENDTIVLMSDTSVLTIINKDDRFLIASYLPNLRRKHAQETFIHIFNSSTYGFINGSILASIFT